MRKSYGLILFENPNQRKTACPPEWLLLNRLQWGLNAVLSKLGATAPWPDHFGGAARQPFGARLPANKEHTAVVHLEISR